MTRIMCAIGHSVPDWATKHDSGVWRLPGTPTPWRSIIRDRYAVEAASPSRRILWRPGALLQALRTGYLPCGIRGARNVLLHRCRPLSLRLPCPPHHTRHEDATQRPKDRASMLWRTGPRRDGCGTPLTLQCPPWYAPVDRRGNRHRPARSPRGCSSRRVRTGRRVLQSVVRRPR
jgi:hypothetical protein